MSKKPASSKTNLIIYLSLAALSLIALSTIYLSKYPQGLPTKISPNDWPTANQNFSNTRSAVDAKIDSTNISQLKPAWIFPIKGISEWGAATTNPIIIGNTVYFQDLKSNFYAVDFNSGKENWKQEYNLDIAGPAGVAIENGRIFGVKGHFEIVALSLKGKELWTANLSGNKNVGIDIQPTAQGGKVYVSTVPGVSNENFYKGGATGILYALDQTTGRVLWSFDTVDSKNIWGNADVNSGGGAWYPPAIDTTKGILYWGLGNPAPWPGTKDFPNGTSRPGPNLYTNSVVALNTKSGQLLWYNQVHPHDLFDYDLQVSPILTSLNIDGVVKDVVIGAGKMGKVYLFDRASGKTIWETSVGRHQNDSLEKLPSGITNVSPGPLGGIETNMAYSDGMIFVPIVNMTVQYTPSEFVASSFNLGAGKGEIVALDASSGKIVWSNKFDSLNVGSATVVNDLVFTSTINGKIYAFAKKTGKQVWEYQAPGGINGWPAVKDNTIIFPVGMGKNPVLLAFKVGATGVTASGSPLPSGGPGKGFGQ